MLTRVALVVAGLAAAGTVAYRATRPLPVEVTPVVRGPAIEAVYATGTVEAEDRALVKAKTSGSVADLLVREGAVVTKGDLLARIDNPVVTFELERGKVELSAASEQAGTASPRLAALASQARAQEADLALARQDLARAEDLRRTNAVAEAEVDRARARVTGLEATLAANRAEQRALAIDLRASRARAGAEVATLESRVHDTEVRSPLDGVVLARSIEPGEVVALNQVLFKVGDTRRLLLEVAVDEADVARISDGRGAKPASDVAVRLYAFPGEVFRGKVVEIYPDANRDRKSFLAKVRLDAPPEGLRSGMSAEVNIIAGRKEGSLLASSEAESAGAVWVVRDGRAQRAEVTIGIRDLLRAEVLAGVGEGELLVVTETDKLAEGQRVAVTVRPPDKLAAMPDLTQPSQNALR
jgi:multidrug efflux pump subunit AcrA (membrane-fusion protein)